MKIFTYKTSGGKDLIINYISKLPKKEKAEAYFILKQLSLDNLEGLNTRQIDRKLWEIKFYRQNRLFYVIYERNSIYLLHICKKQKGKAEKFEIETAKTRLRNLRR